MRSRNRYFHRKRHKPGTSPGTLTPVVDAPAPVLEVIAYGPEGSTRAKLGSIDDLQPYLGKFPVLWLNVDSLGDAKVIERIGSIFGLHSLALEDTINVHQRPKTEDYITNLYTVCRMANDTVEEMDLEQISIFLGPNFVISFQERAGDCWDPIRDRIAKGPNVRILNHGPDYLAYALLDAMIDNYFPVLEKFGDRLDRLEEKVFEVPGQETLVQIQNAKHALHTLRHAVWPLRESVGHILGHETLVMDGTRVFLRDCQDHVIQVLDILESYRERIGGLMDIYLSATNQRMSNVMRVLTVISTIFMPLTFIVGVYGMNFDRSVSPWSMPELGWKYGYVGVLAFMLFVALGMIFFFMRAGWFSDNQPKKPVKNTAK